MGKGITSIYQGKKLKAGDYIIVAVLLLSAFLISLEFAGNSTPRILEISVNGKITERYMLPLVAEYELDDLPYPCTLQIDGYRVRLKNTTCPNHDCEHSGLAEYTGDSIVCLPNRLILILTGGTAGADTVTG